MLSELVRRAGGDPSGMGKRAMARSLAQGSGLEGRGRMKNVLDSLISKGAPVGAGQHLDIQADPPAQTQPPNDVAGGPAMGPAAGPPQNLNNVAGGPAQPPPAQVGGPAAGGPAAPPQAQRPKSNVRWLPGTLIGDV